jgi:hypothetical protein
LVGLADWQGPEDNGIEDLVYGGVGADSEREGEDGRRGESGSAAELAEGVAEVLREGVEERQAALVAVSFADLGDSAEFAAGAQAGFVRRESAALILGGQHLEVPGDFFVQASRAAE